MAFDAYMKLEGIEGEATGSGLEKAIEILSFSWGASNPVNVSGGGMGSGKVTVSDLNIMKKTDIASNTLFKVCCTGKHFKTAQLTLRKAGGEQVVYLTYDLEKVFVSSIQWSGSSGGDDVPTESVSMTFKIVKVTYAPQTEEGESGGPSVYGWDVQAVKEL